MNALSLIPKHFSCFSSSHNTSQQRFFSQQKPFSNKKVKITETTLRDGLQTSSTNLSFETKLDMIHRLVKEAQISSMEIGSIVDPKKVPNMADTPRLIQQIKPISNVDYWVLVANERGLDKALEMGARRISFPTSVSDSFLKKNINCTVKESLDRLSAIIEKGKKVEGTRVRVYISCCPICPIEGEMPADKIAELVQRLFQMKCDEIFPSDTVGQAIPSHIQKMLRAIQNTGGLMDRIGLHLHGNWPEASATIEEALSFDVRLFDSGIGGQLGGCPVLKRAKGNIPTEKLVPFLHQLGYETGIEVDSVLKIRQRLIEELNSTALSPSE